MQKNKEHVGFIYLKQRRKVVLIQEIFRMNGELGFCDVYRRFKEEGREDNE